MILYFANTREVNRMTPTVFVYSILASLIGSGIFKFIELYLKCKNDDFK